MFFFQKLACGAENLVKIGLSVIWESSENQFGRPKNIDKILKIQPPLEKNLDPPLNKTNENKTKTKKKLENDSINCTIINTK